MHAAIRQLAGRFQCKKKRPGSPGRSRKTYEHYFELVVQLLDIFFTLDTLNMPELAAVPLELSELPAFAPTLLCLEGDVLLWLPVVPVAAPVVPAVPAPLVLALLLDKLPFTWTSSPTCLLRSSLSPVTVYLFPELSVRMKLSLEPLRQPWSVLWEADEFCPLLLLLCDPIVPV